MSYNIFEYKKVDKSLGKDLSDGFKIKINSDGILEVRKFYENENSTIEKTHQLTMESMEKIKNIIEENDEIFNLETYFELENLDKVEENEFFFSNNKKNIKIMTFNMSGHYFKFPETTSGIEKMKGYFESISILLNIFMKISNILKEEKYSLTLSDFDDYEKFKEEQEIYATHIHETLAQGLPDSRKIEIEKKLQEMNVEEVENEIVGLTKEFNRLLTDGLNNYGYDAPYYEEYLYISMEGRYVVEKALNISNEVRSEFDLVINKLELALDFTEKYYISLAKLWELKRDILEMDSAFNNDEHNKKKLEQVNKICEENNMLFEGYDELYKKAIKAYVERDKNGEEFINKVIEISKLINANTEKISVDN